MPRSVCEGCGRPEVVCLCSHMIRRQAPARLIVWQDPDEAQHPLSTAPLLCRMLTNSELVIGDEFSFNDIFGEQSKAEVALLYPLKNRPALPVDRLKREIKQILILDGTWRKVKRLLLLNPWLADLNHIALCNLPRSRYLRCSSFKGGVSTWEAGLYLSDMLDSSQNYLDGIAVLDRTKERQDTFKMNTD